jgi:hypothetical protein
LRGGLGGENSNVARFRGFHARRLSGDDAGKLPSSAVFYLARTYHGPFYFCGSLPIRELRYQNEKRK